MIALQNTPALQATVPSDLHQCNVAPVCSTLYSQQLRAIFYVTYCTLQLSDQPCLQFYVFLKLLCKYFNFRRNGTIALPKLPQSFNFLFYLCKLELF